MHALGKFVEERHRITEAWVHWEYSPEEWALFDTVDWKFRKHLVIWLLIGVPLCFGAGLLFLLILGAAAAALAFLIPLLALSWGF